MNPASPSSLVPTRPSERSQANAGVAQIAARVGRHQSVYATANITVVVAGMVNLALLARSLETWEFGQLAVLLVLATGVSVLASLGTLQGTMAAVFGSTGDDDGVGDDERRSTVSDPARAATTGALMIAGVGAAVTIPLVLGGNLLEAQVLHQAEPAHLLAMAGLAGTAGATARLTANLLRIDRRPLAYFVTVLSQSLITVGATAVLLVAGLGLEAGVLGIATGNVGALAVGLVMGRGYFAARASRHDAVVITRRGAPLVPIVLSFQTIQLGDLLLVSRFANADATGFYRAASRFGALAVYWTATFHMAWGPMRIDPEHRAIDETHGRTQVSAAVLLVFLAGTGGVWLFLLASANWWVAIVGSSYADAAKYIPLVAANFALHGLFIMAYRIAEFPNKRRMFVILAVTAAVLFVGVSFVVLRHLGPGGVVVGGAIGYGTGITVLLVLTQRGPTPLPLPTWRLLAIIALTAMLAAAVWPIDLDPIPTLGVAIVVSLIYAAGALAILPPSHRRVLFAALRRLARRPSRTDDPTALEDAALRSLLDAHGRTPAWIADAAGIDPAVVDARVRRLGRMDAPPTAAGRD